MFLNNLSYEQKLAFLSIAIKIINADGILDPKERWAIDNMRIEMGLLEEATLPNGPIETITQYFDSDEAKHSAFLEWLGIAYSDEKLSGEEQKLLRAIALQFNISEDEATKAEQWVLDYKKLMSQAESIIYK